MNTTTITEKLEKLSAGNLLDLASDERINQEIRGAAIKIVWSRRKETPWATLNEWSFRLKEFLDKEQVQDYLVRHQDCSENYLRGECFDPMASHESHKRGQECYVKHPEAATSYLQFLAKETRFEDVQQAAQDRLDSDEATQIMREFSHKVK